MSYDIVVRGFRTGSARVLAARHIARETGVPFRNALAMVDRLPVTLQKKVAIEDLASCLGAYRKSGIDVEAVAAAEGEIASDPMGIPSTAPANPALYALGGAGASRASAAIPVPGRDRSSIGNAAERPSRRRVFSEGLLSWIIAAGLVAIVCCGIFFLARPGHPLFMRFPYRVGARSADAKADSVTAKVSPDYPRSAGTGVETAHRLRARKYVDSAQLSGSDTESAIRFYLLAIAFNKYNANAWYGLIGAYRAAGRPADEERTREAMRRLFGETVFSIEKIIEPFGPLVEYSLTQDGGIFIEYRSAAPAKRAALLDEVYTLAKALRTMCDCREMTIFAATGSSSGLIAHCSAREYFGSIERFEAASRVYFFEAPKKKR